MVAPAGAFASAAARDASSVTTVAPFGGNARSQSSTGTHDVSPIAARVAPVQPTSVIVAAHPQPLSDGANPGAHAAGPTASHAPDASEGIVPAAQAAGGSPAGAAFVEPPGEPLMTVVVHADASSAVTAERRSPETPKSRAAVVRTGAV